MSEGAREGERGRERERDGGRERDLQYPLQWMYLF